MKQQLTVLIDALKSVSVFDGRKWVRNGRGMPDRALSQSQSGVPTRSWAGDNEGMPSCDWEARKVPLAGQVEGGE